jgi:hypothetical protein
MGSPKTTEEVVGEVCQLLHRCAHGPDRAGAERGVADRLRRYPAAVSAIADGGGCALHSAAMYGCEEWVTRLLDQGCPVDLGKGRPETGGMTALHWVARHGREHPETCNLLAARGADLDARTETGITPLIEALLGGVDPVVGRLLQLGAALDLGAAALTRQRAVVAALLAADRSLPGSYPAARDLVALAVNGGDPDVLRALLARKADTAGGGSFPPALTVAVSTRRQDLCELLLGHGADPDRRPTPDGATPREAVAAMPRAAGARWALRLFDQFAPRDS